MAVNEMLSLGSAILFALALWSGRLYLEGNILYYFQMIAYLLLAASSWMIGWYSTAFVLTMCAVTLFLKIKYRYSPVLMVLFSVATLAGGLLLNNHGWIGVLPVVAAVGVVARHVYRLSKVDNANRIVGHVLDVFMENIVGVVLWGLYARAIGDNYQLYTRGIMLAANVLDFVRRLVPFIIRLVRHLLPTSKRNRRRGMAAPKKSRKKLSWII